MFQIKPKPSLNEPGEKKTLDSVKEGLSFVFKTKELLGALSLDLFAVLFGGAVAMIPVFAKDILKTGPIGFGWLNAASDIGSILIVILIDAIPAKKTTRQEIVIGGSGFWYLYHHIRFLKIILVVFCRTTFKRHVRRYQYDHSRNHCSIENT